MANELERPRQRVRRARARGQRGLRSDPVANRAKKTVHLPTYAQQSRHSLEPFEEVDVVTGSRHVVVIATHGDAGSSASRRICSQRQRTVDVYRNGKRAEMLIASRDQAHKLVLAGAIPAPMDVEESELAEAADQTRTTSRDQA